MASIKSCLGLVVACKRVGATHSPTRGCGATHSPCIVGGIIAPSRHVTTHYITRDRISCMDFEGREIERPEKY